MSRSHRAFAPAPRTVLALALAIVFLVLGVMSSAAVVAHLTTSATNSVSSKADSLVVVVPSWARTASPAQAVLAPAAVSTESIASPAAASPVVTSPAVPVPVLAAGVAPKQITKVAGKASSTKAHKAIKKANPAAKHQAASAPVSYTESVSIPSIGLNENVYSGGQDVIDTGAVTHYTGPGWKPLTEAGAAGTYWLAAHHVTHGGPFRHLLEIRVGDQVVVNRADGAKVYFRITSTENVGPRVYQSTVYGTDMSQSRILLQTCDGSAVRFLAHGILDHIVYP